MEEERVVAADVAPRQNAIEKLQAARERRAEPLLLATDDVDDELLLAHEVGVRVAHRGDGGVHEGGSDELLRAEQERVAHRAPDDASEHVAALFVRRHHAVGHEEGHRATVLGQDAQRYVGLPAREAAVLHPGDGLGRGDQRLEDVDVPRGRRALEHREVALQPRPGVDAGGRKGHQASPSGWASNCMNTRFQIST